MEWKFWKRKQEPTSTSTSGVTNQRMFKAATFTNTTDIGASLNVNADLLGGLKTLRYRSRDMVQNNGYAAGIISNLKNNVIGPNGVTITVQGKRANGQLDQVGNQAVEEAWECFSKYGVPDVEGNKDLIKMQEMALQAVAIDGESLILIHRGDEFGKHRIKFEIVSPDVIADYFTLLPSGNLVYQGVEIDEYGKAQAYWLRKHDLNDPAQRFLANGGIAFHRVPASDVIHLYDVQFPKQMRGIPWLSASLLNLHHVSQLQATELTMARLAAMKRVMFKVDKDENYVVDEDTMDANYSVNDQLDAASIEVLQPGVEPVSIEWSTPNTGLADFTKVILRQVAAGVSVSYNAIAKDLESVNYSSARFGALEDRISYQAKQRWFGNAFINRIYQEWLQVQLMYNLIELPNGKSFGIDKLDQLSNIKMTYKGWSSVDPAKDANANKMNLSLMTTTYSEICQQSGTDFGELLTARVREEAMIRDAYLKAGLEPPQINSFLYGTPPEDDGDEQMGQTEANEMQMPVNKSKPNQTTNINVAK